MPRVSQLGWWVLASVLVIALGMTQGGQRRVSVFGWMLLGCLIVFASHAMSISGALAWLYQSALVLAAAWVMAERGAFRWMRHAVLAVAWGQLPVMGLQALQISLPWESLSSGVTGTLSSRSACAVLLGVASLWSGRGPALVLSVASLATGSLMGVPSLWRLWWQSPYKPLPAVVLGWPMVLVLTHQWWWPRLALRLGVWDDIWTYLHSGWLTGIGFVPFPSGFRDTTPLGAPTMWVNYHCTFLDWIARTGLVGTVLVGVLAIWVSRRLTTPWARWTVGGAVWVGMLQSVEAFPMLGMLALVMVMGLAQEARCRT